MVLNIICGLIVVATFLVTLIGFIRMEGGDIFSVGMALFMATMFSVVAGLVCVVINMIGTGIVGYHPVTTRGNLIALTDERNPVGGSFFLGSGVIDGSPTYTFYETQPDGSKILKDVRADGVRVFEDSQQPYVVRVVGCKSDNPTWVVAWKCFDNGVKEIHVPPQSIKTGIVMGVESK